MDERSAIGSMKAKVTLSFYCTDTAGSVSVEILLPVPAKLHSEQIILIFPDLLSHLDFPLRQSVYLDFASPPDKTL